MESDIILSEQYNGDIIRMDRLIQLFPTEHWSWDETGEIDLEDISNAIHESIPEISDPYGDMWNHPAMEQKTREWHIGRIIYFIKHPMEIKDIDIDNDYFEGNINPEILDGWHRYAAARWLYDQGKITEIHCRYGGNLDTIKYLRGELNEF